MPQEDMLRFVDYVSSTWRPSSLHSLLTSRVSYEGESIQSTSPGWQAVCCFFLPLIGNWTRIFFFSEFDFDGTDMKNLPVSSLLIFEPQSPT